MSDDWCFIDGFSDRAFAGLRASGVGISLAALRLGRSLLLRRRWPLGWPSLRLLGLRLLGLPA
jgi:hypothetical protein